MEPKIIIQLGAVSPVITPEKFAELMGVSRSWVRDRINDGTLPTMPRKGKQMQLINLALYWQQALSQPY